MKRYELIVLAFALFLGGCASMETHSQTFVKASEYEKTMSTYGKLERNFLAHKGKLKVSRTELEKDFPCLKPKRIKIYETHIKPSDDPLPSYELVNQPAALAATGRSELWHMKNPVIGFHELKEEDAPFLVTILCPVYNRTALQPGTGEGSDRRKKGKPARSADNPGFYFYKSRRDRNG